MPGRDGLAKDVGRRLTGRGLAGGSLLALVAVGWCGWLDPARTAAALAAVGLWAAVWGRWVRRLLGGVTGDCLGCGCYIGQCLALLTLAARP